MVDCASLENWRAERFRGFESHPLRHSRKFTAAGFLQSLLSSVAIGRARLSYEKLYDLLAVRMIKSGCLAEFAAFAPDPRHLV